MFFCGCLWWCLGYLSPLDNGAVAKITGGFSGSVESYLLAAYRDWETDRKSTRLNSSHRSLSRMPSSA